MTDALEFGIGVLLEGEERARLQPRGELDLSTAPLLEEAVREQLAAGRTEVHIDLARTTFIDSSGVGALVRIGRAVSDAGGHLALVSPTAQAARLFAICGIDRLLDVRSPGA